MMRQVSRLAGIFALFAAVFVPRTALAEAEIQGTISAQTGWTDSSNGGLTEGTSSGLLTLEPGVEILAEGEHTVQRLGYRLGLNVFLADTTSLSLSNNLGWTVSHTFTDFTDGLMDVSVNHLQSNSASPITLSDGTVNALPGGDTQFVGVNGGLGLSHQLGEFWRTNQGVTASYTVPISAEGFAPGASFNGQATLGLDRELELGSMGLSVSGNYIFIEGLGEMAAATGGPVNDQKQVLGTGMARYTRQLSEDWTLDAGAGVTGAAPAEDLAQRSFYPVGNLSIGYVSDLNAAGVSYNRGIALNPFLLETIVADDFVARAGLPLSDTRWLLSGAIGYQHATTLSVEGEPTVAIDVYSVDIAVAYEISTTMNLGARYQFAKQDSKADMAIPDLLRNSITIVFTARYPDRTRTTMPFKKPMRMLRSPTLGDESGHPRPRGI